ncbi:hypothetical protein RHMOL_Rhmol05G0152600 [Rhododendron molle]|uniref:Uncharacterized protein n=1 Tax=Rhododendron molle TaxID=49168 RepID=A0ACC0NPE4_RHOML|nr:hypothetical protein RHMOL_Rhmol05G0152600 [Rhododendron molle]
MEGIQNPPSRTVDEVFSDFKGRRAGLIKALTIEVEKFSQQCDPEKDNLCLYGLPNETWEVNLPVEEVPPELPEPALGINFARDGMQEKDWLSLVAVHCDSWLIGVAFYFGARFGFGKSESIYCFYCCRLVADGFCRKLRTRNEMDPIETHAPDPIETHADRRLGVRLLHADRRCRPSSPVASQKRLFQMINDVPTVYEVVTANAKQPKDQSGAQNNGSKANQSQPKGVIMMTPPKQENGNGEEEVEEDEQGATCGACGDNYAND